MTGETRIYFVVSEERKHQTLHKYAHSGFPKAQLRACRPGNIGSRYIASMASTSRIAALAKDIETQTTTLDKFFIESQMPPPSFDEDATLMYSFPPDVAKAQEALSAALDELWWLNQGPIQTIVAKSVCH
jgi:hypothetical protein